MILLLLAQVIDVASRGESLAIARQDGVTLDGREVKTTVSQIAGVAFAPDGSLCIFGGRPGKAGEAQLVGSWSASDHEDMVSAVAFGDSWVATGSHDRTIAIRGVRKLEGHAGAVLALAAHGKMLASGGADATIRLWEPATGELKRTIVNHGDRVGALAWSPDGKYLASGSRDRTVRIWQPEIGRLVRIVRGHDGEVTALAWGKGALVSGCADGKVRVIDEGSDAILATHDAGGHVSAVAVTEKQIVVAAAGPELRRWGR